MSPTTTPTPSSTGSADQGSTTDQARHVADVAGNEAKQVVGDVKEQARGLLDETKNQVQDQSRTQRDRLVQTLRTFGDDLDSMAEQRGGLASDAAREVAQRARGISQQLDGREPTELLDDLRSFARRRPGMFLAGALVSGVVVGRLLRGARDAAQDSGSGSPMGGYDRTSPQNGMSPSYEPTMQATAAPPASADEPPPGPAVTPTESGRLAGGL